MNTRRSGFFVLIVLFVSAACSTRQAPEFLNKFVDTVYVRLGEWQDRRFSDSLLLYLTHNEPSCRRQALIALGSVQDTSAVDAIGSLLNDPEPAVRIAAAFALGQTRSIESEQLLDAAIRVEKDAAVRAGLYEAYGRATRKWDFKDIPVDTIEAAGFAWGLYRTAGDSLLNPLAAQLLESDAVTVRLGAAHYFARKAPDPRSFSELLIRVALYDPHSEVRMAAALALRKVGSDRVGEALKPIVTDDPDYRVRVNAVAALQNISSTKPLLIQALKDKNVNVAVRAAEVINGQDDGYLTNEEAVALARSGPGFRVKALLYDYAMRSSGKQEVFQEVKKVYTGTTDPYHKAGLLAAMGKTLMAFGFVNDELMRADTSVIRTAAALALVGMNSNKRVVPALHAGFVTAYRNALALKDVAVTSIICNALTDPNLGYRKIITNWQFLTDARNNLTLPRDASIQQALDQAIAYFENKEFQVPRREFNNPINWESVRSFDANQHAKIFTSRGVITIRLLVNDAPGSVANFMNLVQQGVYDGKFFHRVVPNFVAQAGCPRGDGFGSGPHTIRSEFSERRYKTGSVGMASSGKDTESMQWFITHSPTPHLEGAYTIFAEVVEGMDYVHQLEVGDKILKIELAK